ncbi:MAG: hypothetical protein ACRD51_14375 [Candidatus Acidiferrum sp.]
MRVAKIERPELPAIVVLVARLRTLYTSEMLTSELNYLCMDPTP